jgi:NAD(P)-dependent dehydrogenase (short-subunit alcohol dehydrogenase family)
VTARAEGERPLAVIAGAGEGLGVALGRAFAAAGYDVAGVARSRQPPPPMAQAVADAGGDYLHLACDLAQPAESAVALAPHADRVEALVYNAHELLIAPFMDIALDAFERLWRVSCHGAVGMARAVLPAMVARRRGTMIFSGATASHRGGAGFAAFAAAKFALRGFAQALAREAGPQGVHVAHVTIDGLIDCPQSDRRFGPARAPRLAPDAAAAAYLSLVAQPSSAWTHELDLRPSAETF